MNKNKNSKNKLELKEDHFNSNKNSNNQNDIIENLKELYEREKESRCYFQIERDKLSKILQIEQGKYQDLKAKLIKLNEEVDELTYEHQDEIASLKIKIRYLIDERELKLNDMKLKLETNENVNLKLHLDEFRSQYLNGLHTSIHELNEDILKNDELFRKFKTNHINEITEVVNKYTEMSSNVQKVYESRLNQERENFSLIVRSTLNEISEVKNHHINEFKTSSKKSYEELKSYFKDLVKKLVDTVNRLNKEIVEYKIKLKLSETKMEEHQKEMLNIKHENEHLKTIADSNQSMARLYLANKRIYKQKDKDHFNLKQTNSHLDIKYESLLQLHENLKQNHQSLTNYVNNLLIKFRFILENVNYLSDQKVKLIQNELA